MSEFKLIDVKIADRNYPLKINPTHEAKIKNAAEKINAQLKELREKYDARDMQDYLAMILLLQMNDNKPEANAVDIDFSNQLKQIEEQLTVLLK